MKAKVTLALKGAAMGFADAIPGVSGGTMALILGIYERFVAAVSAVLSPAILAGLLKPAFYKDTIKAVFAGPDASADGEPTLAQHTAFLINVVVGILAGLLVGAAILPVLMDRFPEAMRGFFFGLVLASIVVPWSRIKERTPGTIAMFVLFCVGCFALMGLKTDIQGFAGAQVVVETADGKPLAEDQSYVPEALRFATSTNTRKLRYEVGFHPNAAVTLKAGESRWTVDVTAAQSGAAGNLTANALVQVVDSSVRKKHKALTTLKVTQAAAATGGADPTLGYIFVCGAIAICAMILPGISGSFLLLMLGLYGFVLHALRSLVFSQDMNSLTPILTLIGGIIVGLTFFSRLLRWLLAHHHDITMAALAGLMLGSLRALWPFQSGVGHSAVNALPQGIDATVGLTAGMFVFGVLVVTVLHKLDRRHNG